MRGRGSTRLAFRSDDTGGRSLKAAPLFAGLLLVFVGACDRSPRRPAPGAPAASAFGAASSAAAAPLPQHPVTLSELSSPGLRIRSGTIARSSLWGFSELTVDPAQTRLDIVSAPR